nr:MAG TPA: hypothetical protein [Caudoviricetes sp.]
MLRKFINMILKNNNKKLPCWAMSSRAFENSLGSTNHYSDS